MGTSTKITLIFSREKHARWAQHVAEGIIKACALWDDPDVEEQWGRYDSLMDLYLSNEEKLKSYDLLARSPNCALAWLQRHRTRLVIERCSDLQRWFSLRANSMKDELFPQLCLTCALRFPQVPFAAYCRCEQTTSGAVELTRAAWNGERMRFRRHGGDRPFNEDAWDSWQMLDLFLCDGAFVEHGKTTSPLETHFYALLDEAEEARLAGDTSGALHIADAAQALPGCENKREPVVLRGLAGRHLRRVGVRRVMALWSSEVSDDIEALLKESEPVNEALLGEGRFVLQEQERGFAIVDTKDKSIVAEADQWFNGEPTHVVDDFRVLSRGRYYLIDWEYDL